MTESGRNALQRRATAAMEADSRAWMIKCPHCGAERSVWDSGGIRYRAAGTSWLYRRCFACGKRGWEKVYWAGGPGLEPVSAGFVVRLVLAIVCGALAATALILFVALKLAGLI